MWCLLLTCENLRSTKGGYLLRKYWFDALHRGNVAIEDCIACNKRFAQSFECMCVRENEQGRHRVWSFADFKFLTLW